jgi:hypothetical protein
MDYAPTSTTPQQAKHAAAVERGTRTAWQGLAIDVAIAVAVVLLAWLPDADVASSTAWVILGTAVLKSVLTAIASYVVRLKVDPTREAELVDGAYLITDLDTGDQRLTGEAPPEGTAIN